MGRGFVLKKEPISLSLDENHNETLPLLSCTRLLDLELLPKAEFQDWRVEHVIRKRCKTLLKKGKVDPFSLWLGKWHAREIEEEKLPSLHLQWINPAMGYGLFTKKALPKWSYLGLYGGLIRPRGRFFPNVNDYCFAYPKTRHWLFPYTIDSGSFGNHTRFINHSDRPNTEALTIIHDEIFQILFRTSKDVKANEELLVDYGPLYWRHRKKL